MSEISYILRHHPRARRLKITIYSDCRIVVTIPPRFPLPKINSFIKEKIPWIKRKLQQIHSQRQNSKVAELPSYQASKHHAKQFIHELVQKYNQSYRLDFKRISVKNQRGKWGSCSIKGNLNFNYRLLFLPKPLADYIVVHELCHLAEPNHSRRFWTLVARTFPNYKELKKKLKHFPIA